MCNSARSPMPTHVAAAMLTPASMIRDRFAFRSDSDLAQLAALRAGYGLGGCQLGIAADEPDLIPVLPDVARFELEMLEGMAPAQSRAVQAAAGDVLLYAPVVRPDDLAASIAYLTRRLDENTSPDNFLRALFTLQPGSCEWHDQRARFEAAVHAADSVVTASRRTQNRSQTTTVGVVDEFENCADTDWTQGTNRSWIAAAMDDCEVPGFELMDAVAQIDAVVATAVVAGAQWSTTSFADRRSLLAAVAASIYKK